MYSDLIKSSEKPLTLDEILDKLESEEQKRTMEKIESWYEINFTTLK